MSVTFGVIKYVVNQQEFPREVLPNVEITSDGMAYGTIDLEVPIDEIVMLDSQVWRLEKPTTDIEQWSRLSPELIGLHPDCLTTDINELDSGYYQVSWTFLPRDLSPRLDGDQFSIEIFINTHACGGQNYHSAAPKCLVKVYDEIAFTGITGILVPTASYFQGATGVGIPGPTGSQGQTGIVVYGGPAGATGVEGLGLTGIQGITGLGETGVQGVPGATGLAGIRGNEGEVGGTGLQGLKGTTGIRGVKGATGDDGATGLAGIQGDQGQTGIRGTTGPGSQGVTGLIGPSITGSTGIRGIIGPVGGQGITGLVGPFGATGVAGIRGIEGETGHTGLQGGQGATGIQGGKGLTGFQGKTGVQGITGLQNFVDSTASPFPLPVGNLPFVFWSEKKERYYAAVNSSDRLIQLSAGSLKGDSGPQGATGIFGLTDATALHTPFYDEANPLHVGLYFDNTTVYPVDTTSTYVRGEQYYDEGIWPEYGDVAVGMTGKFVVRDSSSNHDIITVLHDNIVDNGDSTYYASTFVDSWLGIGFNHYYQNSPLSILGSNKRGIYIHDGLIHLESSVIQGNKWNHFQVSADQSPSAPPGDWGVKMYFDGSDVWAVRQDNKRTKISGIWS